MNKNDFGYEQVEKEEHYNKVQDVFNNVANEYDLMNDLCRLVYIEIGKKNSLI